MGIFNDYSSSSSSSSSSSGVQGPQGPQGPPGIGFKINSDNNYDMENKKLTNVNPGTNNNDVVVKAQIQSIEGSSPGAVVNDKAVIYSGTGSVHAQSLYLKDAPDDGLSNELRILTPHQSYNNIHLNIADLKNFDGHGNRPSSFLIWLHLSIRLLPVKKRFRILKYPIQRQIIKQPTNIMWTIIF